MARAGNVKTKQNMKVSLKSIDEAMPLIDGIDNNTTESPFMDMARVVAILEGKSLDDILSELDTYIKVATIYATDLAILEEWLTTGGSMISSFVIDGVTYDVCPAEMLTPSRADLVSQLDKEISSNKSKVLGKDIAKVIACFAYPPEDIDLEIEAPKLDDELYVKNTKERFMVAYNKRVELLYEKLDLPTAMGVRSFFFQTYTKP